MKHRTYVHCTLVIVRRCLFYVRLHFCEKIFYVYFIFLLLALVRISINAMCHLCFSFTYLIAEWAVGYNVSEFQVFFFFN